jgi:hypothetical protein
MCHESPKAGGASKVTARIQEVTVVFERFKKARNAEVLGMHLARLKSLEEDQAHFTSEGRKDLVLAVNYELASEATRALLVLRKLEEQGVSGDPREGALLREALHHFTQLPGIPRREVGEKSPMEINGKYLQHQVLRAEWHRRFAPAKAEVVKESSEHVSQRGPDFGAPMDVWTASQIMHHFSVSQSVFDAKYQSYFITLRMADASGNWNEDIDEIGRAHGVLTVAEIAQAKHDFNQAVLNRIKLALAMQSHP